MAAVCEALPGLPPVRAGDPAVGLPAAPPRGHAAPPPPPPNGSPSLEPLPSPVRVAILRRLRLDERAAVAVTWRPLRSAVGDGIALSVAVAALVARLLEAGALPSEAGTFSVVANATGLGAVPASQRRLPVRPCLFSPRVFCSFFREEGEPRRVRGLTNLKNTDRMLEAGVVRPPPSFLGTDSSPGGWCGRVSGGRGRSSTLEAACMRPAAADLLVAMQVTVLPLVAAFLIDIMHPHLTTTSAEQPAGSYTELVHGTDTERVCLHMPLSVTSLSASTIFVQSVLEPSKGVLISLVQVLG